MKELYFVSDQFTSEEDYKRGVGGAEKSDLALIQYLEDRNIKVKKVLSEEFIDNEPEVPKILSHCVKLKGNDADNYKHNYPEFRIKNYAIIHHDYQYLSTRNPLNGQSMVMLPMLKLMTEAKANLFQTDFHRSFTLQNTSPIFQQLTTLKVNNPLSLSCSFFSKQELERLQLSSDQISHPDIFCILDSPNPIKGTQQSIEAAKKFGLNYHLIPIQPQEDLFKTIRSYPGMIFFPTTPETCCRLAVEVKCLNRVLITSLNYGASTSEWFKLSGQFLINEIWNMNNKACDEIIKQLYE